MTEDINSRQSVYNEGIFQIQRLNDCWIRCNEYSRTGKLKEWRWVLDVIFRELCFDIHKLGNGKEVSDFESNEYYKTIKDLDDDIKKSWGANLYKNLNKKEIVLRIWQHQVGKGGKYEDDDSYSIED